MVDTRDRTSKKFLYLVQSAGDLPPVYASIESAEADLLRLTFKKQTEGAVFYPKSTWTDGRNRLLEEALARGGDYLYYIFLDEDVEFTMGDWRTFERALLDYRPAVATPYYAAYGPTEGSLLEHEAQTVHSFDAMFNAFHRDVVHDGLLLPYHNGFDRESWWYSNLILVLLCEVLYPGKVLQINTVRTANLEHGVYPQEKEWDKVIAWFDREVVSRKTSGSSSVVRRVAKFLRVRAANVIGELPPALRGAITRTVRLFARQPRFTVARRATGDVWHRLAPAEYQPRLEWQSRFWRARRDLLACRRTR